MQTLSFALFLLPFLQMAQCQSLIGYIFFSTVQLSSRFSCKSTLNGNFAQFASILRKALASGRKTWGKETVIDHFDVVFFFNLEKHFILSGIMYHQFGSVYIFFVLAYREDIGRSQYIFEVQTCKLIVQDEYLLGKSSSCETSALLYLKQRKIM